MILKDFEAVFHLGVVFNFIYSAIENFGAKISLIIPSPFKGLATRMLTSTSQKVQQLKDASVLKNRELDTEPIKKKIDGNFVNISSLLNRFITPEQIDLEYNKKFKCIYLFAGLFSLSLLVLSGFDGYLDSERLYHVIFVVDCIVGLLFGAVFISTFMSSPAKMTPVFGLFFFVIIIIIFFNLYGSSSFSAFEPIVPNQNCAISFAVVLVLIPFFLHFFRAAIQIAAILILIGYIRVYYKRVFDSIKDQVDQLQAATNLVNSFRPQPLSIPPPSPSEPQT